MLNLSTAQSEQSPQIFNFQNSKIQVVLKDAEPWFVASDIAEVLGYSSTATATRILDDDEKGVQIMHTLGGKQEKTIISESGLYALVLKSRRKEAKPFRRWVTHEVLPSIRRTGSYTAQSTTINASQMLAVRKAVQEKAKGSAIAFKSVYSKLYDKYDIPTYKLLPASKFEEAIAFINALEVKIPALSKPEPSDTLSEQDLQALANFVYYYGYLFRKEFKFIEELLYLVQSPMASKFHDAISEILVFRLERFLESHGHSIKSSAQFRALANS